MSGFERWLKRGLKLLHSRSTPRTNEHLDPCSLDMMTANSFLSSLIRLSILSLSTCATAARVNIG